MRPRTPFNSVFSKWTPAQYFQLYQRVGLAQRMRGDNIRYRVVRHHSPERPTPQSEWGVATDSSTSVKSQVNTNTQNQIQWRV